MKIIVTVDTDELDLEEDFNNEVREGIKQKVIAEVTRNIVTMQLGDRELGSNMKEYIRDQVKSQITTRIYVATATILKRMEATEQIKEKLKEDDEYLLGMIDKALAKRFK